jgi:hypothetical protein
MTVITGWFYDVVQSVFLMMVMKVLVMMVMMMFSPSWNFGMPTSMKTALP